MTPRWRQRRWLLLPNRPLLAGDEVSPQDMSTCTLRTTSSSRCFSMLCPVVHGSFIYLRVLCLCPGRPFPNPPAPYCGSACLSRPFLSGTIVSFIGKNTQMAYLVQVCRWSPNLREFLPFLASNNKRHCQTYLPYRGITKKTYVFAGFRNDSRNNVVPHIL